MDLESGDKHKRGKTEEIKIMAVKEGFEPSIRY